MSRNYPEGWLRAYTDRFIIQQESPPMFHLWVGLTMIAAALKRNVYIDKKFFEVYPNQYVFLIAGSGGCMKSASMNMGMKFIQKIETTHSIRGKMTTEGLIDEMGRASVMPDGRIKPDGSLLIQADELSYIFGKSSYVTDLLSFFTSAYTSDSQLDFLTRGRGLVQVRNPCPTFLAGCTPEQMGEIFSSMTLASGFMARVILVYGTKTGKRIPSPLIDEDLREPLIEDLRKISQLCGEMVLDSDADDRYTEWYISLGDEKPTKDVESFFNRKHVHVLKTAMALSASESDNMRISRGHIELAIHLIDEIEYNMPKALGHIGATQQSNNVDYLEGVIRSVYPQDISHSVLMRRIYRRLTYGKSELDELIEFLESQGKIMKKTSGRGTFYTAIIHKKGDR